MDSREVDPECTDKQESADSPVLRERFRRALEDFIHSGGQSELDIEPVLDALLSVRDRYLEQVSSGRQTWKEKAEIMEKLLENNFENFKSLYQDLKAMEKERDELKKKLEENQ